MCFVSRFCDAGLARAWALRFGEENIGTYISSKGVRGWFNLLCLRLRYIHRRDVARERKCIHIYLVQPAWLSLLTAVLQCSIQVPTSSLPNYVPLPCLPWSTLFYVDLCCSTLLRLVLRWRLSRGTVPIGNSAISSRQVNPTDEGISVSTWPGFF